MANDGSIETKRIFYFVKVIANWEELNESEGLTSKQLSTWVTSNNPKAYLTSLARKVSFKAFSEKYAKNIGDVVKGVREAYGLLEEGTGGTDMANGELEPDPERERDDRASDGHNRSGLSRSIQAEKDEQRQVKIRT